MSDINDLLKKVKKYVRIQELITVSSYIIFTSSTVLIALSVALLLIKSPLYALIGVLPLLLYRPSSFFKKVKTIEKKLGLKGELVNCIQLSRIPKNNKERYSQEFIDAYIRETVKKAENLDFKKSLSYAPLRRASQFLLISVAFFLILPAFMPARFWYSLNHKIDYYTTPSTDQFIKGTQVELALHLNGVYQPGNVKLIINRGKTVIKEKLAVKNGRALKKLRLEAPLTYHFEFLDKKTDEVTLSTLEPLYIKFLSFSLKYPLYTGLNQEVKTGRQIIAPRGTRVHMQGSASQPLSAASLLLFEDTLELDYRDNEFSGDFTVDENGTAVLFLESSTELKEQIIIYAIPDLAPLVDIFYPGYNINLPNDMQLDIGIKCSDDYGLRDAVFHYTFKNENKKPLHLKRGALQDTLFFTWDLSGLGMLPGDEVSYFAVITDNAGNRTKSKTYRVYFPTMEEIYEEVSKKEDVIEEGLKDLRSEHTDKVEEIERIKQKLMKERELTWSEQERLKELIDDEKEILEKIDDWQTELKKTIEKLNQGIILDRESIERLYEISKILQEIAPEELKRALEELQTAVNKNPQDIQKALERLQKEQKELAKALERTLKILKRYRQEQKLKELAEKAAELALKAEELDSLSAEETPLDLSKEIENLDTEIKKLSEELRKLAASEELEQEISERLKELAEESETVARTSSMPSKKKGLRRLADKLDQLYATFTKGRMARLRKKLLDILTQLIEISKAEENLFKENKDIDIEEQSQIMTAARAAAESLYAQQLKSLYVTPRMGKTFARALSHMKKVVQNKDKRTNARKSMELINIVCLEMLRNLEKASEGGESSTGFDQFLQELSTISKGQMSLNQSLFNIFPIPGGEGLTPQQRAQLARLAGKQRALRQALESLKSSYGEVEQQALIDKIIEEMKETEEALYQYKLDRKLIERQKKILTRLLDAQKSIRKEDYSKKRKSKPGQDILGERNIEPLPDDLGKDRLRELIQQALQETYPREYELYIREYFKTLFEER